MAEEAIERLNAAHFCVACRFETRKAISHCEAVGGRPYRNVRTVCNECDEACRATANLLLKLPDPDDYPALQKQARRCTLICKECMAECKKLKDGALGDLADACRKASLACEALLQTLDELVEEP